MRVKRSFGRKRAWSRQCCRPPLRLRPRADWRRILTYKSLLSIRRIVLPNYPFRKRGSSLFRRRDSRRFSRRNHAPSLGRSNLLTRTRFRKARRTNRKSERNESSNPSRFRLRSRVCFYRILQNIRSPSILRKA